MRVALAVGQRLKDAGYNVLYTRTTDRYDSPLEKHKLQTAVGQIILSLFIVIQELIPILIMEHKHLSMRRIQRQRELGKRLIRNWWILGFRILEWWNVRDLWY